MDFSQLGGLLDGMKKEFSQLEEKIKTRSTLPKAVGEW